MLVGKVASQAVLGGSRVILGDEVAIWEKAVLLRLRLLCHVGATRTVPGRAWGKHVGACSAGHGTWGLVHVRYMHTCTPKFYIQESGLARTGKVIFHPLLPEIH